MPAAQSPFSTQVKDELARQWPGKLCCRNAELSGLLWTCGSLDLAGQGRVGVHFRTDHGPVARKILQLVRGTWSVTAQVVVKRRRRLRKGLTYEISVPPQPELWEILHQAGVLGGTYGLGTDLPAVIADRNCCARALLRGAFLGSGWLSKPERGHHLEIVSQMAEHADGINQLCFQFGVPVRITARKDSLLVYLKDGDHIARFLGLVGATEQMLRYEDVRVLKDMKNRVNRQVNADTANLTKTVEAAARQLEAIRDLERVGRLNRLPPALRELAELRLHHPEASLRELGEICCPRVGKSGINHRMRMLLRMAMPQGAGGQSAPGPGEEPAPGLQAQLPAGTGREPPSGEEEEGRNGQA